jgi:hypothetical protein
MATHADADLIIRLYDLRREEVCRAARKFFISWVPASEHEAKQVHGDMSRQDNAYLRQATSYWEMAFSIANSKAIDPELFSKNCGEGLIFALKCQHLAKRFPGVWTRAMAEAEAFIAGSAAAQKRCEMIKTRFGW